MGIPLESTDFSVLSDKLAGHRQLHICALIWFSILLFSAIVYFHCWTDKPIVLYSFPFWLLKTSKISNNKDLQPLN